MWFDFFLSLVTNLFEMIHDGKKNVICPKSLPVPVVTKSKVLGQRLQDEITIVLPLQYLAK